MSMVPITAHHVREATEALAQSARPNAPIRPEPAARRRRWMRWGGTRRLPLAVRRPLRRPAPAVK
jgi:hypothetical protein